VTKRVYFAIACAAAAALVIAVWSNTLDNSFHFDDSHVIEQNVFIRSLDHIPRYFIDAYTFSSLPQNATYRPLVTLTYALDYAVARGLNPRPFHVTQIALLVITGSMLVVFLTPILSNRWAALFSATWFCVHTANTETMNFLSSRSELLSTIGLLGSFVLWQRSAFARRSLLYLVPVAIGALAKAQVVVFAPLFLIYLVLIERDPRALRRCVPAFVAGVGLLLFLNAMNVPEWTSGGGPAYRYVLTQPYVWLHYARLFVIPAGLSADTDLQPFTHWYDTRAIAGYAFVALLVLAMRRLRSGPVAFGLAWFAVALLPTSLFPLAEVMNEHRIFVPYIGLVVAVTAFALIRFPDRSGALTLVAVTILVLHGISTQQRNRVWATEETLWRDVVAKSPGNGRAWMNFGLTQMASGRYAEAKASFERAQSLTPNYSVLEINQGIVEGQLGDHAAAERHFRRALELNADANANFYFARWLVGRGRGPEAVELLRIALQKSPAFADVQALLGRIAVARGTAQPSRKSETYAAAFDRGLKAIARADWLEAAESNREALLHDPRSADALNNLGWSLAQLGFRDEARRAYDAALAGDPNHERARNNMQALR
jgi:Flp pilus assembly protein TadD